MREVESIIRNPYDSMELRFGQLADHYLAKRGVPTDPEGRWKLVQELARALDDAALKLAQNAGGDYSPDPIGERFPPWTPPQVGNSAPTKAARAAMTPDRDIGGVVEGGAAAGRKPSTHESYANSAAAFVAFLGHDDAGRVTPDDVVGFKDHRLAAVIRLPGDRLEGRPFQSRDR